MMENQSHLHQILMPYFTLRVLTVQVLPAGGSVEMGYVLGDVSGWGSFCVRRGWVELVVDEVGGGVGVWREVRRGGWSEV